MFIYCAGCSWRNQLLPVWCDRTERSLGQRYPHREGLQSNQWIMSADVHTNRMQCATSEMFIHAFCGRSFSSTPQYMNHNLFDRNVTSSCQFWNQPSTSLVSFIWPYILMVQYLAVCRSVQFQSSMQTQMMQMCMKHNRKHQKSSRMD